MPFFVLLFVFVFVLSLWTAKCWTRQESRLCRDIFKDSCPLNSVSEHSCPSDILNSSGDPKQANKISWQIISKNIDLYKRISMEILSVTERCQLMWLVWKAQTASLLFCFCVNHSSTLEMSPLNIGFSHYSMHDKHKLYGVEFPQQIQPTMHQLFSREAVVCLSYWVLWGRCEILLFYFCEGKMKGKVGEEAFRGFSL